MVARALCSGYVARGLLRVFLDPAFPRTAADGAQRAVVDVEGVAALGVDRPREGAAQDDLPGLQRVLASLLASQTTPLAG